ncbi:Ubiquitin fusion degradation protein 4 [Linnemannia schmuckeri]|uniref:HECT-type E3 ubiquitin transferase n=1 Tax=Linnemannia schmuckeri TaxID=64567 RepID=A0A9P5VA45_9FUNG|nr:Ubiquitin fusion degradation protein 4 [Linnemannia schmuckeri]
MARPDPSPTHSNKNSFLTSAASSRPPSTFASAFSSASDLAPSSSSALTYQPIISTSHAITRHLAKVSKQAQQDYIAFSSGVDGTLPSPVLADFPVVSSSSSSSRKRTSTIAEQSKSSSSSQSHTTRSRSQSQSISTFSGSHHKKRRLQTITKSQSSSLTSSSSAQPVTTRSRSKASGSLSRDSQDLARFMRQSKMSTSQKRSSALSKTPSKDVDIMDASHHQDSAGHTFIEDVDQSNSSQGSSQENCGEKDISKDSSPTGGVAAGGNNTGDVASSESNRAEGDEQLDDDDEEHDETGEVDEEGDEDDDEGDEDEEEDDYDHHQQSNDQDGIFSSGGSMSGMVSGMSSRLKGILTNLRAYEDPSLQLIALQDLAVLLSVSTEDTLAGYFSCESFVKELVLLLRGTGGDFDNPEIMLLACRCLSNLMEAMPASLGSVVYSGAVPVLCSKLLEIQYIDLAEQSLTTLEKISSEYPHAVVKEGGLAAVLLFLDFFSTNVQRTAVKTAANCCRGMHQDSISMAKDILPNLENLLQYSDQKIVEQACLCFVRLADSYKSNAAHLQSVVTETVLRTILSLLSPNASVIVGPHVYTLLLHFLSTVAEYSPPLGFALLEMDIVDTLFLTLTGTHTPHDCGEDSGPLNVPNVGSRPKEQISEIIGIVSQLLPALPKEDPLFDTEFRYQVVKKEVERTSTSAADGEDVEMKPTAVDRKAELLASHPDSVRRMGTILIPTLIEVYSSTVHLKVRQRAINALVKLIYFTGDRVLESVLKNVELASFLAVILSQQEHQLLVVAALQITDILMTKIPSTYRQYLEREGVTFEISKLAYLGVELSLSKNLKSVDTAESSKDKEDKSAEAAPSESTSSAEEINAEDSSKDKSGPAASAQDFATETATDELSVMASETGQRLVQLMSGIRSMRDQPAAGESVNEQLEAFRGELEAAAARLSQPGQGSDPALSAPAAATLNQLRSLQRFIAGGSRSVATAQKDERGLGSGKIKDWILEQARILAELFHAPGSENEGEANQGTSVLVDLKRMSEALGGSQDVASAAIKELAQYFSRMGISGISSFEFLNSGLPQSLLGYFTDTSTKYTATQETRIRQFIQEFMVVSQGTSDGSRPTPLALLVKKMQEGLTRMETFEVEAAQGLLAESRGGPSSSLATQVRLKLSPEEGTEVPSGYQNLIVSIHAIATFRTLDEYLRPRLKPKLAVSEKASTSHPPKGGSKRPEDTTSKDTAGKSTGLDSVAGASSEESTKDGASEAQLNKNAEVIEPEDSFGESDEGDIEEMDYDLDQRSAVVDADVKMSDATKSETEGGSTKRDDKDKSSKSRAASPSKKDTTSSDSGSAWHIQFSLHGTPISTDMTVYGAIHDYERKNNKTATSRGIWSSMYPIKYKRVDTPAPEHTSLTTQMHGHDEVDLTFTAEMPKGLPQSADYAPILGLLRVLHGLNDDWRRFYGSEEQLPPVTQYMDQQEFVNSKISAKVNRQLEEPLIVASSCLPSWTVGLVGGFPFLFPFETRYTYLQSTAFGFSRSVMRWQNQQQRNGHTDQRDDSQNFLGRIQRQKVRISRQKALESAVRVMDLYGSHQAMLEVEYFEEVGTGLGPTLEFYSVVSKEFCKKFLKLWRDVDSESATKYVTAPQGLYPRPMASVPGHADNHRKILKLFKSLGQFIAKAMLDSRIIDVPLSALFVSQLLGRNLKPRLQLVASIDPVLTRSLQSLQAYVVEKKRIYGLNLPSKERESTLKNIELQGAKLDDMGLDFTLVGYPEIELKAGGTNIPVTIYNVEEYIQLTVDMTVGRGVEAQAAAFRDGFNCVFSIQDLAGFRSEELVRLFGSGDEDWSYETLVDTVKADHGFRSESRAFKNLLRAMSELDKEERRQFLQFITGSPKLPIGGFKNLHPPFTVVCKPFEAPLKADDYLPSVMTCANYLKMPDYSTKEVMMAKFKTAYEEGQGSFHLS